MGIHGGAEKHPLTLVKELFRLLDQEGDIGPLAIQVLQALALDGIVPLILVGAVDGPLEVNDIAVRGKGDAPEDPEDLPHIAMLPRVRAHREPELDVLVQGIDMLLHAEYIDFLIHLQHLLEKAQVGIFQHQQAVRLADDPVIQKIVQPAAVLG